MPINFNGTREQVPPWRASLETSSKDELLANSEPFILTFSYLGGEKVQIISSVYVFNYSSITVKQIKQTNWHHNMSTIQAILLNLWRQTFLSYVTFNHVFYNQVAMVSLQK